jgi:hypothetical protein
MSFSKANRPKLPGAYINFENLEVTTIPAQPGAVVGLTFTHDWGPANQAVRVASFGEFQAVYGRADNTHGYRAARGAFQGEGLQGRGGAGEVVAYRMCGSAAAKATKTINKVGGGAGITLTARYEGTRGNDLVATVTDDSTGIDLLTIYDGTTELERFYYAETTPTVLAAEINETSDWITASGAADGFALDQATDGALTGGNNGTTLVAGDYTTALDDLSVFEFGVYADANLTDNTIQSSNLVTWLETLDEAGKGRMAVVGGPIGETLGQAIARSAPISSPFVVSLGVGTVEDETLGPSQTALQVSTAQLAPRVAGILAARGEYQSITAARIVGAEIISGASTDEQDDAFDAGVVVLARDSHSVAPVNLRFGLSSWTSDDAEGDGTKPYLIYRQPKYVMTMQGMTRDLLRFAVEEIIGLRPINDDTRQAVLAEVKRGLAERENLGVIQPGWTCGIDQDPPPTDEDEFIGVAIGLKFGRSLEQLYFTITVG